MLKQKKHWHKYTNGNHFVFITNDGTKVRMTKKDGMKFMSYDFPESFDFKINNRCNAGCRFCHECSTYNGSVPSLKKLIKNKKSFIHSIHPYTEVAIGGGNVFESPDLLDFLKFLKKKNVIANITINQCHLLENKKFLEKVIKKELCYGIGISITDSEKLKGELKEFIDSLGSNVVFHVIAGLFNEKDFNKLKEMKNKKILFLGYKSYGKGSSYYNDHKTLIEDNFNWLKENLDNIKSTFNVLSFDNLAIQQLDPKNNLSIPIEQWKVLYQGSDDDCFNLDGSVAASTMFIDLPNMEVARNSSTLKALRKSFDIEESIESLFEKSLLRKEKRNDNN